MISILGEYTHSRSYSLSDTDTDSIMDYHGLYQLTLPVKPNYEAD